MILFTILVLILAVLVVFTILMATAIGSVGVIVFGDVIVCIVFIALILYYLVNRRK